MSICSEDVNISQVVRHFFNWSSFGFNETRFGIGIDDVLIPDSVECEDANGGYDEASLGETHHYHHHDTDITDHLGEILAGHGALSGPLETEHTAEPRPRAPGHAQSHLKLDQLRLSEPGLPLSLAALERESSALWKYRDHISKF